MSITDKFLNFMKLNEDDYDDDYDEDEEYEAPRKSRFSKNCLWKVFAMQIRKSFITWIRTARENQRFCQLPITKMEVFRRLPRQLQRSSLHIWSSL